MSIADTEFLKAGLDDFGEPIDREAIHREDVARLQELPEIVEGTRKNLKQIVVGGVVAAGSALVDYFTDAPGTATTIGMVGGGVWALANYYPYYYHTDEQQKRERRAEQFRSDEPSVAAQIDEELEAA